MLFCYIGNLPLGLFYSNRSSLCQNAFFSQLVMLLYVTSQFEGLGFSIQDMNIVQLVLFAQLHFRGRVGLINPELYFATEVPDSIQVWFLRMSAAFITLNRYQVMNKLVIPQHPSLSKLLNYRISKAPFHLSSSLVLHVNLKRRSLIVTTKSCNKHVFKKLCMNAQQIFKFIIILNPPRCFISVGLTQVKVIFQIRNT